MYLYISNRFTRHHDAQVIMIDSMDYGSEELVVVGRGDSPALAVLDRNARSLAQRVADETKEELEKVLKRVENVRKTFRKFPCELVMKLENCKLSTCLIQRPKVDIIRKKSINTKNDV